MAAFHAILPDSSHAYIHPNIANSRSQGAASAQPFKLNEEMFGAARAKVDWLNEQIWIGFLHMYHPICHRLGPNDQFFSPPCILMMHKFLVQNLRDDGRVACHRQTLCSAGEFAALPLDQSF